MPAGVFNERKVRDSDGVKPKLGLLRLDFVALCRVVIDSCCRLCRRISTPGADVDEIRKIYPTLLLTRYSVVCFPLLKPA